MVFRRAGAAWAGVAISAAAFALLWPHARDAGILLAAQNDPVKLSDIQLKSALRNHPDEIRRQIEAALTASDPDLADSFVEVAAAYGVALPDELVRRVAAAVANEKSISYRAGRFATGLVTGEASDVASLSGTVVGDLLVFGDVRDVAREGKRLAMGEEADRLILGLAAAGLAVTAATYASAGGAAPVRAGLTLVKDARKVGRLGEGLSRWVGRSARDVVDAPALQRAVTAGSWGRPGEAARTIKAAFRAEKAATLVRFSKDVGRIGEKAGTRGALDALKLADSPKDIARAARLAEAKGGQSRAIMKMLGRGTLLLAAGTFNLALWLFGAMLTLVGFLVSIKATTERLTLAWIARRKTRRPTPQLVGTLAPAAG